MAVQIFPLLIKAKAVGKSWIKILKHKITQNEIPGKINPTNGFFILLRNPCKTKVPANTKTMAEIAANIKTNKTTKDMNAILFYSLCYVICILEIKFAKHKLIFNINANIFL